MLKIVEATCTDIPIIQSIADKTWRVTYEKLLSKDQLEYMLNNIYSSETLESVIENGSQTFLILYDERVPQGFAAFGRRPEDPTIVKLHKLYVLPKNQGKGYGRLLIDEVISRVASLNVHILDLNVKKDNPAKSFYEKLGFKIIREEEISFGPYTLYDYVMRMNLKLTTS
jgi:diamine N-acetyltransferase